MRHGEEILLLPLLRGFLMIAQGLRFYLWITNPIFPGKAQIALE